MATDKEKMMRNAYLLNKAKGACGTASSYLDDAQSAVEKNWKGESGGAMDQALQDVTAEIRALYAGLEELEKQMYNVAASLPDTVISAP